MVQRRSTLPPPTPRYFTKSSQIGTQVHHNHGMTWFETAAGCDYRTLDDIVPPH